MSSTPAAPALPHSWQRLAPWFSGLILLGRRLPALLITLLFLAITWLGIGQEFDVAGLIWEESPPRQFLIGVAVALLLGYVWIVTYLVDGQEAFVQEIGARKALAVNVRRHGHGVWRWLRGIPDRLMRVLLPLPRNNSELTRIIHIGIK